MRLQVITKADQNHATRPDPVSIYIAGLPCGLLGVGAKSKLTAPARKVKTMSRHRSHSARSYSIESIGMPRSLTSAAGLAPSDPLDHGERDLAGARPRPK
jgi:hypothetical protein